MFSVLQTHYITCSRPGLVCGMSYHGNVPQVNHLGNGENTGLMEETFIKNSLNHRVSKTKKKNNFFIYDSI